MKILLLKEDHMGQYFTDTFCGWYSDPSILKLISDGFTEEEANVLLRGETVEIDGIFGEFKLEEIEEGYQYVSITKNRETYDNV